MRLEQLSIEQFRLFDQLELALEPGLNFFVGGNGAGKTSVLEAAYLLAYGRSFRGSVRDGLIRRGSSMLRIFAEVHSETGELSRVGLERTLKDWRGRIDGQALTSLSELYRKLAVVCFEPGSHELIAGGSEHRRRYLDWALFHVEPDFFQIWRRYQRALRQRNVLLKSKIIDDSALEAWEAEMALAGERLTSMRSDYIERLRGTLITTGEYFLPEAGEMLVRYQPGWNIERPISLADALATARSKDFALGHTTVGPHRADLLVTYECLPSREQFSRGQEKLTALACIYAQAERFAIERGEWPILCMDDLASELDRSHMQLALHRLAETPAQILLTGTERPVALAVWPTSQATFHVEQGKIHRLL